MMKKLFISLILLLFVVQVNAQNKEVVAALKTLEKVKSNTEHAKKGLQPATWLKLSSAYDACYDAPIRGIWQGANQMDIKLLLKDQQILSSTQEEKGGRVFNVDNYEDKALYYDENGLLVAWVVKTPVVDNALDLSFDALKKATELDAKGKSVKKIGEALNVLKGRYTNEGMSYYNLGDNSNASKCFERSMEVSSQPIIGQLDTVMAYYAGVTAAVAGDLDRAIKLLTICTDNSYEQNGDAYAHLSECYNKKGDTVKSKEVLTVAFEKFPTNQSILVSLVNLYIDTKDDPEKVLQLLKVAQTNEPDNATLFYAEGNVYKNLNRTEEAIKCFQKSSSINPNYEYAPFTEGSIYYDKAVEIQEKAQNEMDQAKYEALMAEMEKALESAIEPFERAFQIATDPQLKLATAEYLKNIYFRFREKSEIFKNNYEKYNSYYEENK